MEAVTYYIKHTRSGAWAFDTVNGQGANKTFTVTAWMKATEPTKVRLCLYGHKPGWGREASGALSKIFIADHQWKQITHENTFEEGITRVSLVLIRCPQLEGGEVWFDDIEVVEK